MSSQSKTVIRFEGSSLLFQRSQFSTEALAQIDDCRVWGSGFQQDLLDSPDFDISGDPEHCKDYLLSYGAWVEADLRDHVENLKTLLQILAQDINDPDKDFGAYFDRFS